MNSLSALLKPSFMKRTHLQRLFVGLCWTSWLILANASVPDPYGNVRKLAQQLKNRPDAARVGSAQTLVFPSKPNIASKSPTYSHTVDEVFADDNDDVDRFLESRLRKVAVQLPSKPARVNVHLSNASSRKSSIVKAPYKRNVSRKVVKIFFYTGSPACANVTYPYDAERLKSCVGSCTGTMVSELHVLTAGHCVKAAGSYFSEFRVAPAMTDILPPEAGSGYSPFVEWPYGIARVKRIRSWGDPLVVMTDMALLTLDRPIGKHTGFLEVDSGATAAKQMVRSFGYPSTLTCSNKKGQLMWERSFEVRRMDATRLTSDVTMCAGDSGSSILSSTNKIVGLLSQGEGGQCESCGSPNQFRVMQAGDGVESYICKDLHNCAASDNGKIIKKPEVYDFPVQPQKQPENETLAPEPEPEPEFEPEPSSAPEPELEPESASKTKPGSIKQLERTDQAGRYHEEEKFEVNARTVEQQYNSYEKLPDVWDPYRFEDEQLPRGIVLVDKETGKAEFTLTLLNFGLEDSGDMVVTLYASEYENVFENQGTSLGTFKTGKIKSGESIVIRQFVTLPSISGPLHISALYVDSKKEYPREMELRIAYLGEISWYNDPSPSGSEAPTPPSGVLSQLKFDDSLLVPLNNKTINLEFEYTAPKEVQFTVRLINELDGYGEIGNVNIRLTPRSTFTKASVRMVINRSRITRLIPGDYLLLKAQMSRRNHVEYAYETILDFSLSEPSVDIVADVLKVYPRRITHFAPVRVWYATAEEAAVNVSVINSEAKDGNEVLGSRAFVATPGSTAIDVRIELPEDMYSFKTLLVVAQLALQKPEKVKASFGRMIREVRKIVPVQLRSDRRSSPGYREGVQDPYSLPTEAAQRISI
eukprot:Plantae.Rhodophyta-Purpureofilum_apyrenoidigerum.ctg2662.p1 GENE.Plantae.Rhodophyta-Purpureofilum_apyrenoidigerum.ctg2662~~Plantae.Rhodophyta-Purpureofilum_apyrenoidigerum.ctg2662.p1  ORF type:complete len:872 (+),score=148.40 Plantae.Rhodophyta-Purpureofilum_apyrenoidigerum.ctg2662:234-2849(+)